MILTDWIRCCIEGTCLICAEWSPCESEYPGRQSAQFQRWAGRGLSVSTWENKMRKFPRPIFLCQIRKMHCMIPLDGAWRLLTMGLDETTPVKSIHINTHALLQWESYGSASIIFDTPVCMVLACIKKPALVSCSVSEEFVQHVISPLCTNGSKLKLTRTKTESNVLRSPAMPYMYGMYSRRTPLFSVK